MDNRSRYRFRAGPPTEGVVGVHCVVALVAVEVKVLNEPDLRNSLELSRNVTSLGRKGFELDWKVERL